ncbi:hypothetical protein HYW61_01835 [candidate division WWE3 bacterium]|nr:hypothetical protein [candidate division WWE3 bacterium]
MLSDFIVNLFTPRGFTNLVEILITAGIFLYAIFAFVVLRQVNLMNKSFTTRAAFVFTFISYAHFFAAAGLAILSLILL